VFSLTLDSLWEALSPTAAMESTSCWLQPSTFFSSDLGNRCRKAALRHMLPDLEDGFSLPVFLAEISEIPRMVRGGLKLASGLPSAMRSFLSKPVKQWSKAQLATSFGWLPFIRDVKEIVTRLWTLREDIQSFLEESGKRRSYHYTVRLDPADLEELDIHLQNGTICTYSIDPFDSDSPATVFSPWIKSIDFDVVRTQSASSILYTMTLDYSYTLKDFGAWAPILAGLDRFGINVSLSDLWEVVPFSFVVDWFYNVQSILSKFDYTNLKPQLVVNDCCESLKYSFQESRRLEFQDVEWSHSWPETGWSVTPFSRPPIYLEDVYYRRTGLPSIDPEDFPNLELPHGMQIVLGSALVASRVF